MPTIGRDGTFDDGTNFTGQGTGTSVTSQTPAAQDPMAPRYVQGSGYWVPGEGWVQEDEYNRAQQQYQQQQASGTAPTQPTYDPTTNGNMNAVANPYSDATYYGNKANTALMPQTGPAIDQTVSGQSRDVSMDALGMLQSRAAGGITPAQQLQAQQTAGAVNAVSSGAASIKGGAQARAAAGMTAAGTAQRTAATGAQDQAALAAREQADAQNQYFGATSAQRGRDLGLATSQAQLDAAQRAQNAQKEQNYASAQFNQQKAITDDQLGRSAADQNAGNAQRSLGLQEQATSFNNAATATSGVIGGLTGAAKAYGNTQDSGSSGSSTDNPWDPSKYSGSDPQMKTNIKPVSDSEADRLRKAAEGMEAQQRASLAAGPSVRDRLHARAQDVAKPDFVYDGKYLPVPETPAHKPTLDEAMASQVAKDREEIAAEHPTYGLFSPDDAPRHPAGGWSLGEGFSDDPAHNYRSGSAPRPENTWAPGSADFYAGSHAKDLTTSDPTAKRAAFVAGLQHANEAQDSGHFGQLPDYMQPGASREQPKDTTARRAAVQSSAPRADALPQRIENNHSQMVREANNAIGEGGVIFGPGAALGAGLADREETARQEARMQNPPASLPVRARQYASDQLTRLYPERNVDLSQEPGDQTRDPTSFQRDTSTSDPKAKTVDGGAGGDDGGPMANAARSMDASSYEYKPEHLPPDQKPGEVNVGPMADKMKADPVASTAIVTDPKSGLLAIDKTKALKVVMGSLASLQRQVDGMRGAR